MQQERSCRQMLILLVLVGWGAPVLADDSPEVAPAQFPDRPSFHPEYLSPYNSIVRKQDRFCGAYAAWHALRSRGIEVSVDQLVDELGIKDREGCNVHDMVSVLRRHGVSAEARKITDREAPAPDCDFIAYLRDEGGGHFVWCRPTAGDQVWVVNAPKPPYRIPYQAAARSKNWSGVVVAVTEPPAIGTAACLFLLLAGGLPTVALLVKMAASRGLPRERRATD